MLRTEALLNGSVDTDTLHEEYTKHMYQLHEKVKLKKGAMVFKTTIKGVSAQGHLLTADSIERHFDFGEIEWVI
jgi:BirA family biotin operon repressor/biotin-[acetyl-CoA-carboxylase] ligase